MKNGDEIHELSYDLIKRAVHGEPEALAEILRIYVLWSSYFVTLVAKKYQNRWR